MEMQRRNFDAVADDNIVLCSEMPEIFCEA